MDQIPKKKNRLRAGILNALSVAIPMGYAAPLAWYGSIYILSHTGYWWLPLLIAYIVVLQLPVAWWIQRRDTVNYHTQVGHEIFYQEHPEELRRALRKARKKGIPAERQERAAYYRSLPEPYVTEDYASRGSRRFRTALLYVAVGILIFLGTFLIWRALPFPQDMIFPGKTRPDYTPVFFLAAGVFVLATAAAVCLEKPLPWLKISTTALMLLTSWSLIISVTKRLHFGWNDLWLQLGCTLAYVLAAFVLPALAGDLRTPAQAQHDRREFQIQLLELGYIDEKALRDF